MKANASLQDKNNKHFSQIKQIVPWAGHSCQDIQGRLSTALQTQAIGRASQWAGGTVGRQQWGAGRPQGAVLGLLEDTMGSWGNTMGRPKGTMDSLGAGQRLGVGTCCYGSELHKGEWLWRERATGAGQP